MSVSQKSFVELSAILNLLLHKDSQRSQKKHKEGKIPF
jgi:hypothetical protein